VATIEIKEAKMNLMLVEIIVKNKFEIRPKISSEYVNMSGRIPYLTS
jgi:hypothetical protein